MGKISYITSESVTEGHPDKIADQVSDALLDELYKQDPMSRVAIETLTTTGLVIVAGEVTTKGYVDVQSVVRRTLKEIGYTDPQFGIDCEDAGVLVSIHEQSPNISQGVTAKTNKEQGAGDQGMMYGYACNETPELMPFPIIMAHKLTQRMAEVRKKGIIKNVGPDGKSQVSVRYVDGKPDQITAVVIAQQHKKDISEEELKEKIMEKVIKPVCGKFIDSDTKIHINATGAFVIGGPEGDTGVTGRKIMVDTYGGIGRHGGGCFCITGDALVNTEKGLLELQDLKAITNGLLVKTDLSPAKAEDWYDNGEMETIEITTDDGYRLEGTKNQYIRVLDENGNYVWHKLDSVADSDWIAIQRKNRLFSHGTPITFSFQHKPNTFRKNSFEFPENITEDYAYLMGLLIGDGRCNFKDGISIAVCEEDQKKNVQNLYKRLFGKPGKIFGHWAFFSGIELRAYLENLGLGKWRSWEKRVPHIIFKSPKNVMAAFLRGLFDTDGSVRKGGRYGNSLDIKLTSTSLELIRDVQQLLLNFGIVSKIQAVDRSDKESIIEERIVKSKRILYHLRLKHHNSILVFKNEIGFNLPRKSAILSLTDVARKRDLARIPNQRYRLARLWKKLTPSERYKDKARIGRFLRSQRGKATKELTYSKLKEFLDTYEHYFSGNLDFEYLRTFFIMGHYFTKVSDIKHRTARVFDISVPGVHTFTANGFVVHNSGKDPSKVDRSGAYMARYAAKNIVAAGLANKCEIQVSYAIGVAQPTSINVDCFGTNKIPEEKIIELVKKHFDFRPAAIIEHLKLRRPIYKKTAAYGHFGREDPDFTWEQTDKAKILRNEAGL